MKHSSKSCFGADSNQYSNGPGRAGGGGLGEGERIYPLYLIYLISYIPYILYPIPLNPLSYILYLQSYGEMPVGPLHASGHKAQADISAFEIHYTGHSRNLEANKVFEGPCPRTAELLNQWNDPSGGRGWGSDGRRTLVGRAAR